jgi:hypothetical protein
MVGTAAGCTGHGLVAGQETGGPCSHTGGEFRWHKRSDEYYILDRPIRRPRLSAFNFRTWRQVGAVNISRRISCSSAANTDRSGQPGTRRG